MAVLMAFTALVFVAPQKVSAVTAGKYDVRLTIYVTDRGDSDGKKALVVTTAKPYKCYESGTSIPAEDNNTAGVTLNYISDNGQGSAGSKRICLGCTAHEKVTDTSGADGVNDYIYPVFESVGYPESVYWVNEAALNDGCKWQISKVEVAPAGTGDYKSIWEGNVWSASSGTRYSGFIDKNGSRMEATGAMSDCKCETSKNDWTEPRPEVISWLDESSITKDLTISGGSADVKRQMKFKVLDQYGVVMSTSALKKLNAEPKYTVSATNFGPVDQDNTKNLYYSSSNGTENSLDITAKNTLKSSVRGVNSYKVTAQVTLAGTGVGSTKEFTIYDPKYTVYFNANGGENLSPSSYEVYYGESLNSQAELDNVPTYPTLGSYAGHSWLGLFDSQTGGNKINLDESVTEVKIYWAHWNENTYTVVFLDKEGRYVYIQYVPYNSAANGEAAKEKLPSLVADDNYHYNFKNWEPSVDNVTENTITNATYTAVAHTFGAPVEIAANCQHGAGTKVTCTSCGYEKLTTDSKLGDHVPSAEVTTITAPTCENTGKGTHYCTLCSTATDEVVIPALGHSYQIEVTKEASCDEEGERTLTCTRCGEVKKEKIAKTQHEYIETQKIPATCGSAGYTVMTCACGDTYNRFDADATGEHSWNQNYDEATGVLTLYCENCNVSTTVDIGANLTDFVNAVVTKNPTCKEKGTVLVTAGDDSFTVDIPTSTTHSFETEYTAATCGKAGSIVNKCSICEKVETVKTIEALVHDYHEEITVAPTCTTAGTKTLTCKNCGDVKTEAIAPTGHKASKVVLNCTSGGEIKCVNCGETVAEIPAREHDYTDGEVRTIAPTCESGGIKYTKCVNCDAEKAEPIEKLSHNYDGSEWVTVVSATCTTEGVEKRECANGCGSFEIRKVAAVEHKFNVETTEATCTTDGRIVTTCDNVIAGRKCDYSKIEILEAPGHDLDDGVTHAQDCLSGEYTTYTCKRGCGYQEIKFTGAVSGYGHDFSGEEKVVAEATCTEDGEKTVKCLNCDATETQVIPKTGHNYLPGKVVAPTCTESGYTLMVCQNDNSHTYKQYDETKPAKGHTWSAWAVTKDSTNTEAGEMERVCTVCREAKETAVIPAGGHSFVGAVPTVVEEATCKTNGKVRYTCTAHENCGVSIVVDSEKLPHDLATDVVSATCTEDGYIKTYCKKCEEVFVNVTLTKKGHSWNAWTTKLEPTCGKDGVRIRTCANCGEVEEAVIPATGKHSYVPTEVKATCTERGHTIYSCVGCGHAYRDDFTPVLGHDFGEWEDVDATCTTPGGKQRVCRRVNENSKPCGYTEFIEDETKPATGHNMSEWTFVTHPTVKNAYAKWRQCLNPGCTHDEHESGAGSEHEAADGINIYYVVDYYNEWVTDTYDTLTQNMLTQRPATYTQLAKTYKTEKMSSVYVLKNTEAVYDGKTPWRDKDVNWGAYDFLGWSLESGKQAGEGTAADLSAITKNTSVYALFSGKDVYYSVIFYNANGETLTIREHILHGHAAEYPAEFGTPTMKDNVQFKFKFRGWSYDFSKVYDDVGIFARYDATLKKYTLVYRDWDGTELGREEITHGGVAENVPEVQERAEDNTYVYAFLNKWTLKNGDEVDLNNFSIPVGVNEGDEINIYASHTKRAKIYKVTFDVVDPYYQVCGGVNVQVMDSKGQLLSAKLTELDGSVEFSLTYDVYYKISFLRGNYYKEGTFTLDPSSPGSINVVPIIGSERTYHGSVVLENNVPDGVDEKCKCICHSFLSGIWITFLNLLYRVFGIKHVCCSDMYVVHGDKLTYGH